MRCLSRWCEHATLSLAHLKVDVHPRPVGDLFQELLIIDHLLPLCLDANLLGIGEHAEGKEEAHKREIRGSAEGKEEAHKRDIRGSE